MEDQRQNTTPGSSEGRLTVVANAITSKINTVSIADSIFASLLEDGRSTKESDTKNSSEEKQVSPTRKALMAESACVARMSEKCLLGNGRSTSELCGEGSTLNAKIKLAVAAAVAEVEYTATVDVRALREQTLSTFACLSTLKARQLTGAFSEHQRRLRHLQQPPRQQTVRTQIRHHLPRALFLCRHHPYPTRPKAERSSSNDRPSESVRFQLRGFQKAVHVLAVCTGPREGVVRGSPGIFRHLEAPVPTRQSGLVG
jgi:hypothetical protein